MSHKKKIGTAGRFGPRYGRTIRTKISNQEALQKAKQECINCHKKHLKRLSIGVYYCPNCEKKMTGKAYTIQ